MTAVATDFAAIDTAKASGHFITSAGIKLAEVKPPPMLGMLRQLRGRAGPWIVAQEPRRRDDQVRRCFAGPAAGRVGETALALVRDGRLDLAWSSERCMLLRPQRPALALLDVEFTLLPVASPGKPPARLFGEESRK
jgi:hypothetical protein